jgi:hypothetical protein
MYSGNHSPCHPLTTMIEAARRLSDDSKITFCFVGGGSEWRKIKEMQSSLPASVRCLPYQPLSDLSGSLSAADLHVVVMGDPFVGLVHPCKIYNVLGVAASVLYIGPKPSHLSEILARLDHSYPWGFVGHGDVDGAVREIQRLRQASTEVRAVVPEQVSALFSQEALLPRLVAELERR